MLRAAADGKPSTIVAAVLPDACSRHASPVRPHSVTSLLKSSVTKSADVVVVVEVEERGDLARVEPRRRVAVVVEGAADAVVDLEPHLLLLQVRQQRRQRADQRPVAVELEEERRLRPARRRRGLGSSWRAP